MTPNEDRVGGQYEFLGGPGWAVSNAETINHYSLLGDRFPGSTPAAPFQEAELSQAIFRSAGLANFMDLGSVGGTGSSDGLPRGGGYLGSPGGYPAPDGVGGRLARPLGTARIPAPGLGLGSSLGRGPGAPPGRAAVWADTREKQNLTRANRARESSVRDRV